MKVFLLLVTLIAFSLQATIQPEVLAWSDLHGGKVDIMLEMSDKVNLQELENTAKHMEDIPRGNYVFRTLFNHAERTQKNIIKELQEKKVQYYVLWIQNTIAVYNVDMDFIQTLAKSNEIENIWLNGIVNPEIEEPHENLLQETNNSTIEWSIEQIKAPELWKKGFEGQGMVLGLADTGVHYTHEALVTNYRGNENGRFKHDYNWFDPASNSKEPNDRNGHGTHCSATFSGGNKGRKVGLAPKSKWIACRPFSTSGRPADFIKCLQFFLAPHDLEGKNPNPALRPHVTSHSYFCSNCNMLDSIKALRAAGSVFIKSCGNRGPSCRSITEPGFYKEALCAGALAMKSDDIASFSSRGPTADGLIKPDFSCPGSNINSAYPGSSNNVYRTMSGTSMAAPHLNGAFGLIWSAFPRLSRKIDETIEIFKKSSKRQTVTNQCSSSGSPNNVFGYGTINLLKAYEVAKEMGY